jgi:glucosamine-6-phosphate deaminase
LPKKLARARGIDLRISCTTDRRTGLIGCDAVLTSFRAGGFDARHIDESIPPLYGWMRRSFSEPLALPSERVVRLHGDAPDPEQECRAFDRAIEQAGGLDLTILGLGPNGHLGFNDPPADPTSPSRVVDLTPESIAGSSRYWGDEEQVPKRALTVGMAQLLAARAYLLLVSGERKRDILHRALHGPVTPDVPASYLQQASNVTVIADRDAAGSPHLDGQ